MRKETNVLFIFKPGSELKSHIKNGLKEYTNVNLTFPPDTNDKTLLKFAPKADIIVGWRPTKELLEKAVNLKLFINPGAGVKHLIGLFTELNKTRNVTLVNGHGNSYFTAQHAVALLLAVCNKVIPHHSWLKQGKWRTGDADAISIPLKDRKIGLLGYGAINSKVHKFLSGFGVEFYALKQSWDNAGGEFPAPLKKYTPDKLDEFLKAVDTLIIALPQTEKTRGLINLKRLKMLGREGIVINVGRGDVIKEDSLYKALERELIAGAGIDVWYDYDPKPDSKGRKYPYKFPFHRLNNIVLSPHRAASPMNDLPRWGEVIENISRLADGKRKFLNEVDVREGY